MDNSVKDDRIRVEPPDHIRDPDSQITASLLKRRARGLFTIQRAMADHPNTRGNMVRVGGILYGLGGDVLPKEIDKPVLKPVLSLYSRIALLKKVPAHETLGYSRTFETARESVIATVPIKKPCSGFAVAAGTLWAPSCEDAAIYRVDLKSNEIVAKIAVGPANTEGGIAFGAGSAWIPSDPKGVVSRVDPATNKVIAEITVPPDSFTAVYAYNLVWVSSTAKSVDCHR